MKKIKINSKIKNSLIAAGILVVPSAISLGIYFGTKKPKAVWTPTKDFLALKTSDVDIVSNVMNARGSENLSQLISVNNLTMGFKGAKNLIAKNPDGSLNIIAKYDINLSTLNNNINLSKEYLKINKSINKIIKNKPSKTYGIYAIKDVNKNKFIVELVKINSISTSQIEMAQKFVNDIGEMSSLPTDRSTWKKNFTQLFMADHYLNLEILRYYNFDLGVNDYLSNDSKSRQRSNKEKTLMKKYDERIISLNVFDKEHIDPESGNNDIFNSNIPFDKYAKFKKEDDENSYDLWTKIVPTGNYDIKNTMIKVKVKNPEDFSSLPKLNGFNNAAKVIGLNSKVYRHSAIYNEKFDDKNTYYTLPDKEYLNKFQNDPVMTILKGIKKESFGIKGKKIILEVQLIDTNKIKSDLLSTKASLLSADVDSNYIKKTEIIEIPLDKLPKNWDDASSESFDFSKIVKSSNFKINFKWFKQNFWDKENKSNFVLKTYTGKFYKKNMVARLIPSLDLERKKFKLNIQFYNIDNKNSTTSIETTGIGKVLNPSGAYTITTKELDLSEFGTTDPPIDMSEAKIILKKLLTQYLPRYNGEPLVGPGLDLLGKLIPALKTLIEPFIDTMALMSKDFITTKEGIRQSKKNGYKLSFEVDSNGNRIQDWHDFRYQKIFEGEEGDKFLEKLINIMSDSSIIDINHSLEVMKNFENEAFNKDPSKNHWTSIEWLTDLGRDGHYKLYSLLSVFNDISDVINLKVLEKYPQANFDLEKDKKVDELIIFLKQNKIIGNNFSINDIINNPLEQITNILLGIAEKNIKIPDSMIDGILNIIPLPLFSENKEGFLNLINYLFENRNYKGGKWTNLRVLSEIFGKTRVEKLKNIKNLLTNTDDIISNILSLLKNTKFNDDQLDILANLIAKIPIIDNESRNTIEKLVPFIKSILPPTIDLINQITEKGLKTIFSIAPQEGIDFGKKGSIGDNEKKVLINYFNKININHKKYLEYFLDGKTIEKYVSEIKTVDEAKEKLFSNFELFLSTVIYKLIENGSNVFGDIFTLVDTLVEGVANELAPRLIKTINQLFLEGLFNKGKYSLRKLFEEANKKLGLFLPMIKSPSIKPILDLFLGGGNSNLLTLLWDSIDNGLGKTLKTAKQKNPDGKTINKFFANIFKLFAPSGFLKGNANEANSISNQEAQELLQGFLQGFNSKQKLVSLIKKLISKELSEKNISSYGKFGDILINIVNDIYDNGGWKSFTGSTIQMPKTSKMLKNGLIELDNEELKEIFKEIKEILSSLNAVPKIYQDVKNVLLKIMSIKAADFDNFANLIFNLLNNGINSIKPKEINHLLNILKVFDVFDSKNIPDIGEPLIKLLNSGILKINENEIKKIIKFIGKITPIPSLVQSIIDKLLEKWDEKPITSTSQIPAIYTI